MANHDYIISNQTFPSTRTDINSVLQAIVSNNSSATEPAIKYAYMMWYDTNTDSWKMRNADNDDWIQLATFDQATNTVNFLDSTISSPLSVTGTATAGAEIRLPEDTDNGSNYVALKAPDTLASDVTFTLPSADGTTDQVLKTDGSGNLSFTDVSGGLDWQSSIVTGATLSAVSGNGYWINTTSNACTITLPASASVGDTIVFVDYARTWGTNAVTINTNSLNFQGGTSNASYATDGLTISITYSGATQGWIPTDDDTSDNTQAYSVDFLVVAGGGGGGGGIAGGGGAGGYRTSTQSVAIGTAITVTVGDGGAGGVGGDANGSVGSNSSISGSGLTTTTSAGGAYGGRASTGNGGDGGSGGGVGGASSGTGGLGNTPSTSPSQGNNGGSSASGAGNRGGGGGGGASVVGSNGTSSGLGNGGNGTASSITGSSVTRSGGGGGGCDPGGTAGTGGSGGGANGSNSGVGSNATINTGGGGGGGGAGYSGGAGGKGVVILSMPDASYSGTTTGSPTVATGVSGNTVLTFTGSGSYTA
jgi:hypothetical protein